MNWEQFRAILWLRWRLTRNQFIRSKGVGAVLAGLATVLLVLVALGAGVGATLLAVFALNKVSVTALMFVWDGAVALVVFLSVLGVVTELQRSETVDLTRLLHLPIALKQVFWFNYLASLVSVGTVIALSTMLGLTLGLAITRGAQFLLTVPLIVGFVFMVSAWIYCLRGWLLSLMINPRRRRSVIMWMSLTFIAISQTPQLANLAWQRQARADREARQAARAAGKSEAPAAPRVNPNQKFTAMAALAERAHPWVPFLWLPNGVRGIGTGDFLPMIWGSLGMFAIGWLGMNRAFRSTIRFYRAEERVKKAPIGAVPQRSSKPAGNWVARQLPWLPEDTAAIALAQLRSLTRATEIRMMLAMGLFMAVFLPFMILWGAGSRSDMPAAAQPFIGTGLMMMVLFTLLQLVCNQFGCDRDAFRGFVLLPTSRARLLFGKNLALFPIAAVVAIVPLAAVTIMAHLSPLAVVATMLQFCSGFLIYCIIGNLASILVPYRIAAGSLKPTKQSWQMMVSLLVVFLSFPLVVSPIFVPPTLGFLAEHFGGFPAGPVNLLAALLLAGVVGVAYWLTLRPLGRLFRRRETQILRAVTEVME